jgi:hypothetical protein
VSCVKPFNSGGYSLERRFIAAWTIFTVVFLAMATSIQTQWRENIELAKLDFIESNHARAISDANHVDFALRAVYESLRTLAQLPSVREIDRHATNLSREARVTFQQVYNNLASSIDVSEVYIVPIDINPNKIDPVTLRNEEPILMFDQLILNAGSGLSLSDRQTNTHNHQFRPARSRIF